MGLGMINRISLVLSLLILGNLSFAQISNDYGYDEYKKRYPKESYLFLEIKSVDVFDIEKGEMTIETIFDEKILYLNNNAYNLSSRGLYYDQFSEVYDIEAFSMNPENGKYKKEKVKNFTEEQTIADGVSFYDDSRTTKFKFPNLKEGSYSQMKHSRKTKDYHLISQRSFRLGSYRKLEVKQFKVHEDIDLGFELFNMGKSGIEFSEIKEGKYKIYTWELKEKEKENIYGDDEYDMYYTPHIVPYVKSYIINGEKTDVFNNLGDLYKWYYSLVEQVNPTEKEELKLLADSITNGAETELEKVKRIYYWVQNKVKYIAFGDGYGGFIPRDPDLIYERRFGDCKDMSCLTINLLKELEIPAYFTWVGTRSIPYGYSKLFTPQVDNHMIATYVNKEGEKYFLDATDSYLEFGRPSAFIQGKEVLISFDKEKYELAEVPILAPAINSETEKLKVSIEEEELKGIGEVLFTGYYAGDVFRDFNNADEEQLKDRFKRRLLKGSNKFIVNNIKFERVNESKDSVSVTYDFEIGNYLKSIGDALYLDLNLSKQLKDLKVDEKHNTPLVLEYKWQLDKTFEFTLPQGYKIDFLPEEKMGKNEMMNYNISYQTKGDKIVYNLFYQLNTILVEVDGLEEWNKIVKKLASDLDESIKLIKE